ncbi:MAG: hypothetical protein OXI60_04310 [Acidiferrobacterales bacterium]|nr:hypothetical protein [Acidiferrobacterales bacterium]
MMEVLKQLGISRSSWYSRPKYGQRGRPAVPIDPQIRMAMGRCANLYPWWATSALQWFAAALGSRYPIR